MNESVEMAKGSNKIWGGMGHEAHQQTHHKRLRKIQLVCSYPVFIAPTTTQTLLLHMNDIE